MWEVQREDREWVEGSRSKRKCVEKMTRCGLTGERERGGFEITKEG